MAKLADAADLKSADRKVVGVQFPLRAPNKSIIYKIYSSLKPFQLCPDCAQTCDFSNVFLRASASCSSDQPVIGWYGIVDWPWESRVIVDALICEN